MSFNFPFSCPSTDGPAQIQSLIQLYQAKGFSISEFYMLSKSLQKWKYGSDRCAITCESHSVPKILYPTGFLSQCNLQILQLVVGSGGLSPLAILCDMLTIKKM